MKTVSYALPCLAIALTLSACQQSADSTPAIDNAEPTESAAPAEAIAPPAATPTETPSADPTGNVATTIPAALQGKWGMVPADCTSTRGDAKGLLTIGPRTLKFYESVGTLATETDRGDSMIRGQFSFTGEGMTWTRDVSLSANGNVLTRTERGGDEPGGPFTYTRCA